MDLLTTHQQKALNFKQHISLTANAGSGKTFVLSRRYVEIALSEYGSIRKIAAITFTDKAASELYKKIAEYVEEKFRKSSSEEEKKLLNKIRRQLVSSNISTIHSFCIDILRQFPVEAGLDANFRPIDELTSDELIELSIEETIKNALSGKEYSEDTKYLIRLFGSRAIFASQLRSLIKDRKKVFQLQEEIYNQTQIKITEFFYSEFLKIAGRIIQINLEKFINVFTDINESVLSNKNDNTKALEIKKLLSDLIKTVSVENRIQLLQSIKEIGFTKSGTVGKLGYLKDGREGLSEQINFSEKYINEVSALELPGNHKEIEKELAIFGLTILKVFSKVVEEYESKKKENSYLDYEDILILTKNLLKIPSVKKDLSDKFKYIMVDEYQDTNEIQYKIFLPILADLKEGNLFVVGDEKQSIYMFRDAELEVFKLTKKNIESASGEQYLLSLPDSFRMAPGICLFVNKLFRNLFSNPNELFNEVNHTDLVCAKQDGQESLVEIIIGASEKKKDKENSDIKLSEAELVAERIISLVNRIDNTEKLNWKDIAVLVRKRKSFSSLEQVFIEKKIPFNIIGGKGFYQRQSVYDIYNYFSFLLDNKNDASLVGILRSPFFNLSDSLIYEIFQKAGRTLWEKLNLFSVEKIELKNVIEFLKLNISLARSYTASQILRKILSESPYLSVIAQKASGTQESANISKLIKLTIDFQNKGFKTLYDYVNFLKESIEETEDESQAAIADESDSVKVMTLHQAKGLEYPAVFLYNAHEITNTGKVKKKNIQADKNYGLLTKVPLNKDYFSDYHSAPINTVFDVISAKKEAAEIKRLFYVGCTRAKNYLFISAPEMENYKTNSFMQLLREGLDIDYSQNNFTVNDELQILKIENEKFVNSIKLLKEEIKIRRDVNDLPKDQREEQPESSEKKLMIDAIQDFQSGEIITATKFAIYNQCPLKYHLSIDYGISELIAEYKKLLIGEKENRENDFELNYKENEIYEDKIYLPAQIKGSIIHKILQQNNSKISGEAIKNIIIKESGTLDIKEIDLLKKDIENSLKILFESEIYKQICSYGKTYNEYEIYLKEKNYFLHGILDKLIVEDKKAIIVDYKTDNISKEEISGRASKYFPQLKFYSYIVSRLFKDLTSFELRLIFINFTEEKISEIINRNEATEFGNEIERMVTRLRLRKFNQNLSHCKECSFAIKNSKCIVDWA
jgi:ATP-dependent helicase/nuclease subunit A